MNPYLQYMYSYPHKTAYRHMEGVKLGDYVHRLLGPGHGLYLHVPFCESKCGYCNLFSVTGALKEDMDRYLDGLERQMIQYGTLLKPEKTRFSSFTIGGGTPLLLTEGQLSRVFSMTERYLNLEPAGDVVIETAPNQTTRAKLEILKGAKVTRVSMGIQSFCEEELKTLGRNHEPSRAREALDLVMSFGFPCVNLDFIYGIPGQGTESLLRSLNEAVTFGPQEIFLYPLYVNHGARLKRTGMVLEPEKTYIQYREASRFLQSRGYRQDSMRRFVRQKVTREFSDCGFSASLALGCGGRSYLGNLHFCTPYAITAEGCRKVIRSFVETEDFTQITHGIFLSREEEKRRYAIRHVLIRPGLKESLYRERFGRGPLEDFPVMARWMEKGLAFREHGVFLVLTEQGMGLSDYLGPQLISEEILEKMREWEVWHGPEGKEHDPLSGQPKKL